LLQVGAVSALLLGAAGTGLALWRPGLRQGGLTAAGREVMAAVALAVLGPLLPSEPTARESTLQGHLARLEATIAGLPPALQAEVGQLLSLLATSPARLALTGLADDWRDAPVAAVRAMLQDLRLSSLALRQQVYHALRDLTNAAYFADAAAWPAIGYPGPRVL
jgi:hypothetical protein